MSKYTLRIHRHVEKFLALHPEMRERFFSSAHVISNNPTDLSLDIKPLSGLGPDHYRLRISKYRFLFQVIEQEVLVYFYDAGSRGSIYK